MPRELTPAQTADVLSAVGQVLEQSPSFRALSSAEQRQIRENTDQVAALLRADPTRSAPDPFAVALSEPVAPTVTTSSTPGFRAGTAIAGAQATGTFLREVDFPAFVAELIQGVFRAIVEASIEQMRAYSELVQSVVLSANEFRDQNVSENQARDHLAEKYPNVFQVDLSSGGPRLSPKQSGGFFDEMPDFQSAFPSLDGPLGELDADTVEEKLVPAARDELARDRQRMLATMVLMGINRIIVTDGQINAKVKFNFSARDKSTSQGIAVGYANMGTTVVESQGAGSDEYSPDSAGADAGSDGTGTARRITTGAYNYVSKPEIKITSMEQSQTEGELAAEGSVMGAVNINFRSETFPLEQMVSTGELLRLNQVQQRTPDAPGANGGTVASGGTVANGGSAAAPVSAGPPSSPPPSSPSSPQAGDGGDAVAASPA